MLTDEDIRLVSPPARGRGLKRGLLTDDRGGRGVAPRAGAWIETGRSIGQRVGPSQSPPARGRGLKRREVAFAADVAASPPARGRGLKPGWSAVRRIAVVAPRAGAWIETRMPGSPRPSSGSPPARGRGLKPARHHREPRLPTSPPARGRGLKHVREWRSRGVFGRPPRGGVD